MFHAKPIKSASLVEFNVFLEANDFYFCMFFVWIHISVKTNLVMSVCAHLFHRFHKLISLKLSQLCDSSMNFLKGE